MNLKLLLGPLAFVVAVAAPLINAREQADRDVIAALDVEYQAAVERNDWQGMDRILHPDFTLILSKGKVVSRAEILESARVPEVIYEKQVEVPGSQTVRMFGSETATVTALLWLKGTFTKDKKAFEYKLWFTDTYVKTKDGWKYALGQASERLPD